MILFMDGFDTYGGTLARLTDGLYAEAYGGGLSTVQKRTGTHSMFFEANSFNGFRKVLPALREGVGCGLAFYFPALPGFDAQLMDFRDGDNVSQVHFAVTSTGRIRAYRDGARFGGGNRFRAGNLLGESEAPAITAASWNHVEIYTEIDDLFGKVRVAVNGETVLELDALNTRTTANGTIAQVGCWNEGGGSANYWMDDLYLYDSAGSDHNAFPIGDHRVFTLFPDADVTEEWTRSSGDDSFALVDEAAPNDAGHLTGEEAGDVVELALSALPPEAETVAACMILTRQLKTDAGTSSTQAALVSSGEVASGTARPITTQAAYYSDVIERDPATDDPWTPLAVSAANLRLTRTA